jgi:hypothetical protein
MNPLEMNIAWIYAYFMYSFVTLIFGGGLPLLYGFTLMAFCIIWFSEKKLFIKNTIRPPPL